MKELLDSFTKERLEALIEDEDVKATPEEQEKLAEIALEMKKAKPVAWLIEYPWGGLKDVCLSESTAHAREREEGGKVIPLYAGIPDYIFPQEITTREAYFAMRSSSLAGCYRDGWNDYKAALLHGKAKHQKGGDK